MKFTDVVLNIPDFRERLEYRLDEMGRNQTWLAERMRVSKQDLFYQVRQPDRSMVFLTIVSRILEVDRAWWTAPPPWKAAVAALRKKPAAKQLREMVRAAGKT